MFRWPSIFMSSLTPFTVEPFLDFIFNTIFCRIHNKYAGLRAGNDSKTMLFTKITAAENEDALIYNIVRGQYVLAVIFTANIKYVR